MKPFPCLAFASAAILVSCSNIARTPMPHSPFELKAVALQPSSAAQFNSLRLISEGNHLALAAMTASPDGMHSLSISAFGTDRQEAPQPLGELPSPFGIPFWDVATAANGLAKVWTRPGSAISSLSYQVPGQSEINLTGKYPMGVFQHPRFVRGLASPAVTACALQSDGEALVLFREGMESGQAQYRPLPAAGSGTVLEGLLLRAGNGYLLLAKYAFPAHAASPRTDPRGESVPGGVLRCLKLDTELRAAESAFSPFGDSAVFEFDADASGDSVYVLATSRQGFTAAVASIPGDPWHWTLATEPFPSGGTLFSPAIATQGDSADIAFIAVKESGARDIMSGRISFRKL